MAGLPETAGKTGPALMPGLSCAKTIGMTHPRLGQRLCRAEAASLLKGLEPVRVTGLEGELLLDRSAPPEPAMPGVERTTLFLHDAVRQELWAPVNLGIQGQNLRIPQARGIAGQVFTTGESVNIPDAYTAPRVDPATDRRTGYRTRSLLCCPMMTKAGRIIGGIQALNKHSGPFPDVTAGRMIVPFWKCVFNNSPGS
jgi:GAF domain-containing protein